MAIKNKKNGFTLLIAIIFMSVMLAFGLALGSLSYKQQVLASDAIQSQYAFYVADAALECALYADQEQDLFSYPLIDPGLSSVPEIRCDNRPLVSADKVWSATRWVVTNRLSLDSDTHCADVTVYKYKNPQPLTGVVTYIFSQGYNVSCDTVRVANGVRFVARGINIRY
ncbi:MAG: pilus assembly PilX N-terminal domain-containing protein [bacterium]|nr:pilus assembly PilX N-terminal domain-containing protein [bacterium]